MIQASPQPADGRVEIGHPGFHGRQDIGQSQVPGVVGMESPVDVRIAVLQSGANIEHQLGISGPDGVGDADAANSHAYVTIDDPL